MKVAVFLLACACVSLVILAELRGYQAAYSVAYGVVVTLALSMSATFFWLWRERATPLALGMGFSWAGTSGVMGWWWLYHRLGEPQIMVENELLFLFVSSYLIGGILHFQVIIRSLGLRAAYVLVPTALFMAAATFL